MDLLSLLPMLAVPVVIVFLVTRRNRERVRDVALRSEIEARVCFATTLDHVSILGAGGLWGTRGQWIPVRGPKRLIVGTNAFMISAPLALREFLFRGCESSIAFSHAPSRFINRDWIVITGQVGGREVRIAITRDNLLDVWQALAGTGAAP